MEQQIEISNVICQWCQNKDSILLEAFAESTKWDTIKRGIEGFCPVCERFTILTEEDD